MKYIFSVLLFLAFNANATNYYPTSIAQANIMGKVGDSLIFKAGTYTGALKVKSGFNYKFIGAVISNPNSSNGASIYMYNISNASIDGLTIKDSNQYAIFVEGGGNNKILNCVFNNVGVGVQLQSNNNLLQGCYIHDLNMVVNTKGGSDDYGANGVIINGNKNVIQNNVFERCKAASYDFGFDGGAVEIFNSGDSNVVVNNFAKDCMGFVEFGSQDKTKYHANGCTFSGNILVNNGNVCYIHYGDSFGTVANGAVFSYNVIGETTPSTYDKLFKGNPLPTTTVITNNTYFITTTILKP